MRHNSLPFIGAITAALVLTGCGDSSTSSGPAPQSSNGVTVISPNGGESFRIGETIHVKWAVSNPDFHMANILIGCATNDWLGMLSDGIKIPTTEASLIIPDSAVSNLQHKKIAFPVGATCKIRVEEYQQKDIRDTSDAPFTVAPR